MKEFRDRLADHYGSIESLFTGWISLYCYEPHVGERILRGFVEPLTTLNVLFESDVVGYERDGDVRLIDVETADGQITRVACELFVDATEYGDGLAVVAQVALTRSVSRSRSVRGGGGRGAAVGRLARSGAGP